MIMEYVEGMSADKLVHLEGPLPCAGLWNHQGDREARGLHARTGLCASRREPSNILIAPDGTVKLSDFGLAKTHDDTSVTLAGGILGTPHYLPRSRSCSHRPVDRRSDIYTWAKHTVFLCGRRAAFKGRASPRVDPSTHG
jgi:serine/threonine-protein kinase